MCYFLMMVAVVVYAGIASNSVYLYLGIGYATGGLCWLIASRISAATLVTDFAIIRNTSKKGNVLGWNQVTDFFVHEIGSKSSLCVFVQAKRWPSRSV